MSLLVSSALPNIRIKTSNYSHGCGTQATSKVTGNSMQTGSILSSGTNRVTQLDLTRQPTATTFNGSLLTSLGLCIGDISCGILLENKMTSRASGMCGMVTGSPGYHL